MYDLKKSIIVDKKLILKYIIIKNSMNYFIYEITLNN